MQVLIKKITSETSDHDLAVQIKQSDTEAFKIIYYRYHKSLYSFIWRKTQNTDISNDLTQEVYTRFWQNREKLDAKKSLKGFLFRTASNLIIDHYRKESSKQRSIEKHQFVLYTSDNENHFEIKDSIDKVLNSLSEKQKEVFILNRIEGLKLHEIADMLEISVKKVEYRLYKALVALRNALK